MNTKLDLYEIHEGSEVIFFSGNKNRNIAYDAFGKIILCKHPIPLGYAKITSIEEKEKYYLVTAEHIIKDVYSEINYKEFLEVLPLHGYKVGFDRIFKHKLNDGNFIDEHQIFAYNLKNKAVIVAETFHKDENDYRDIFNSIMIYLPGVNSFRFVGRNTLFEHGGSNMSVFNLRSYTSTTTNLLKRMNDIADNNGGDWPLDDYPNLWTYEKSDNVERDKNGEWILGEWALQRLKLANPECLNIFKGCNWLAKLKNA